MPIPLMEKLRMRMIANSEENLATMLHSGEPSVVELVYRKLGSLKVRIAFVNNLIRDLIGPYCTS